MAATKEQQHYKRYVFNICPVQMFAPVISLLDCIVCLLFATALVARKLWLVRTRASSPLLGSASNECQIDRSEQAPSSGMPFYCVVFFRSSVPLRPL